MTAASTRNAIQATSTAQSTATKETMPPQLDFRAYTSGDDCERQRFRVQLREAMQRWGFVSLVHYGVPSDAIEQLFAMSRAFFALDEVHKMSVPHPPVPNPHRGYSYLGQEFTSGLSRAKETEARHGRRLRDLKETFDWGSRHDTLFPSVWPDDAVLPGFRAVLDTHFERARELHRSILRALAESLDADPDTFLAAHQCHDSEARLAHYPPVQARDLGSERGTSRICEHTDSGSVTLLWQDNAGGLEIEDPATGTFIPVSNPAPAVLVNLGDAMERWTNGLLPAAYHRVGKPSSSSSTSGSTTGSREGEGNNNDNDDNDDNDDQVAGRFSIMYFGKPDRNASLAPLGQFVSAERPAKYAVITGATLNQGTLLRTYEP